MMITVLLLSSFGWAGETVTSRGFQQARRVAAMELGKDLPSRAVWLGSRVVNQSKPLAIKSTEQKRTRSTVVSQ
jgi:hypothetical protein